jgi:hypothetical protein
MTLEEKSKKRLLKFKKVELIKIILEQNLKRDINEKKIVVDMNKKYKKDMKTKNNHIKELQNYIKKFRACQDKFGIEKGQKLFIEYKTELGEVRTALGYLLEESKNHINIKIKDRGK